MSKILTLLSITLTTLFFSLNGRITQAYNKSFGISKADSNFITDQFVDSTSLGVSGQVKIEILQMQESEDSLYATFNLYAKQNGRWELKQSEKLDDPNPLILTPNFSDFNNDGFLDLTVKSGTAARGANEMRRLYIFNQNLGKLIRVTNSESYPNLQYNKELNCVDSWMVYSGSSTVFLKLEADSLREFAVVSLMNGRRTVELIEKDGTRRTIKKGRIRAEDDYIRYKTYRPLKVNNTSL